MKKLRPMNIRKIFSADAVNIILTQGILFVVVFYFSYSSSFLVLDKEFKSDWLMDSFLIIIPLYFFVSVILKKRDKYSFSKQQTLITFSLMIISIAIIFSVCKNNQIQIIPFSFSSHLNFFQLVILFSFIALLVMKWEEIKI